MRLTADSKHRDLKIDAQPIDGETFDRLRLAAREAHISVEDVAEVPGAIHRDGIRLATLPGDRNVSLLVKFDKSDAPDIARVADALQHDGFLGRFTDEALWPRIHIGLPSDDEPASSGAGTPTQWWRLTWEDADPDASETSLKPAFEADRDERTTPDFFTFGHESAYSFVRQSAEGGAEIDGSFADGFVLADWNSYKQTSARTNVARALEKLDALLAAVNTAAPLRDPRQAQIRASAIELAAAAREAIDWMLRREESPDTAFARANDSIAGSAVRALRSIDLLAQLKPGETLSGQSTIVARVAVGELREAIVASQKGWPTDDLDLRLRARRAAPGELSSTATIDEFEHHERSTAFGRPLGALGESMRAAASASNAVLPIETAQDSTSRAGLANAVAAAQRIVSNDEADEATVFADHNGRPVIYYHGVNRPQSFDLEENLEIYSRDAAVWAPPRTTAYLDIVVDVDDATGTDEDSDEPEDEQDTSWGEHRAVLCVMNPDDLGFDEPAAMFVGYEDNAKNNDLQAFDLLGISNLYQNAKQAGASIDVSAETFEKARSVAATTAALDVMARLALPQPGAAGAVAAALLGHDPGSFAAYGGRKPQGYGMPPKLDELDCLPAASLAVLRRHLTQALERHARADVVLETEPSVFENPLVEAARVISAALAKQMPQWDAEILEKEFRVVREALEDIFPEARHKAMPRPVVRRLESASERERTASLLEDPFGLGLPPELSGAMPRFSAGLPEPDIADAKLTLAFLHAKADALDDLLAGLNPMLAQRDLGGAALRARIRTLAAEFKNELLESRSILDRGLDAMADAGKALSLRRRVENEIRSTDASLDVLIEGAGDQATVHALRVQLGNLRDAAGSLSHVARYATALRGGGISADADASGQIARHGAMSAKGSGAQETDPVSEVRRIVATQNAVLGAQIEIGGAPAFYFELGADNDHVSLTPSQIRKGTINADLVRAASVFARPGQPAFVEARAEEAVYGVEDERDIVETDRASGILLLRHPDDAAVWDSVASWAPADAVAELRQALRTQPRDRFVDGIGWAYAAAAIDASAALDTMARLALAAPRRARAIATQLLEDTGFGWSSEAELRDALDPVAYRRFRLPLENAIAAFDAQGPAALLETSPGTLENPFAVAARESRLPLLASTAQWPEDIVSASLRDDMARWRKIYPEAVHGKAPLPIDNGMVELRGDPFGLATLKFSQGAGFATPKRIEAEHAALRDAPGRVDHVGLQMLADGSAAISVHASREAIAEAIVYRSWLRDAAALCAEGYEDLRIRDGAGNWNLVERMSLPTDPSLPDRRPQDRRIALALGGDAATFCLAPADARDSAILELLYGRNDARLVHAAAQALEHAARRLLANESSLRAGLAAIENAIEIVEESDPGASLPNGALKAAIARARDDVEIEPVRRFRVAAHALKLAGELADHLADTKGLRARKPVGPEAALSDFESAGTEKAEGLVARAAAQGCEGPAHEASIGERIAIWNFVDLDTAARIEFKRPAFARALVADVLAEGGIELAPDRRAVLEKLAHAVDFGEPVEIEPGIFTNPLQALRFNLMPDLRAKLASIPAATIAEEAARRALSYRDADLEGGVGAAYVSDIRGTSDQILAFNSADGSVVDLVGETVPQESEPVWVVCRPDGSPVEDPGFGFPLLYADFSKAESQRSLAAMRIEIDGEAADWRNPRHVAASWLHRHNGDLDATIEALDRAAARPHVGRTQTQNAFADAVAVLRSGETLPEMKHLGASLRRTHLPQTGRWLDLDEALEAQAESVRAAVEAVRAAMPNAPVLEPGSGAMQPANGLAFLSSFGPAARWPDDVRALLATHFDGFKWRPENDDGIVARRGDAAQYVCFNPQLLRLENGFAFDRLNFAAGAANGDFGFKKDNPGGQWLAEKRRRAEQDMADAKTPTGRKGLYGAPTAFMGYTKPMYLPVELLSPLGGVSDERRHPGDPQFDRLMDLLKTTAWNKDANPVMVFVNHLGHAYINEGNTSVAVAAALKRSFIRTELAYWNGGEDADGDFSPRRIAKVARAHDDEFATQAGARVGFSAGGRTAVPPFDRKRLAAGIDGIDFAGPKPEGAATPDEEAALRAELARIAPFADLVFSDLVVPQGGSAWARENHTVPVAHLAGAVSATLPDGVAPKMRIVVALSREMPDRLATLHHEAFHALWLGGRIETNHLVALRDAALAQDWKPPHGYAKLDPRRDGDLNELAAERFARWSAETGRHSAAFGLLEEVAARNPGVEHERSFRNFDTVTADQVFEAAAAGALARTVPDLRLIARRFDRAGIDVSGWKTPDPTWETQHFEGVAFAAGSNAEQLPPETVYHGSLKPDIKQFHAGTHFGSARAARARLVDLLSMGEALPLEVRLGAPATANPRIYQVRLDVRNPFPMEDGLWDIDHFVQAFEKAGIADAATLAAIRDDSLSPYEFLAARGHDSIVYRNHHEDSGARSWIAFDRDAAEILEPQPSIFVGRRSLAVPDAIADKAVRKETGLSGTDLSGAARFAFSLEGSLDPADATAFEIALDNPLVMSAKADVQRFFDDLAYLTGKRFENTPEVLADWARRLGHDGLVLPDGMPDAAGDAASRAEVYVFDPAKISHAGARDTSRYSAGAVAQSSHAAASLSAALPTKPSPGVYRSAAEVARTGPTIDKKAASVDGKAHTSANADGKKSRRPKKEKTAIDLLPRGSLKQREISALDRSGPQKEILKLLTGISHHRAASEAFRLWVEVMAVALGASFGEKRPQTKAADPGKTIERQRAEIDRLIGTYLGNSAGSEKEAQTRLALSHVTNLVAQAFAAKNGDVLGQIFMGMDWGNSYNGQFFTPDSIGTLLSEINMADRDAAEWRKAYASDANPAKRPFYYMQESACGAGALLLRNAYSLEQNGFRKTEYLLDGIELDDLTARMAFVQLALSDIPARIWRGDALADPRKFVSIGATPAAYRLGAAHPEWMRLAADGKVPFHPGNMPVDAATMNPPFGIKARPEWFDWRLSAGLAANASGSIADHVPVESRSKDNPRLKPMMRSQAQLLQYLRDTTDGSVGAELLVDGSRERIAGYPDLETLRAAITAKFPSLKFSAGNGPVQRIGGNLQGFSLEAMPASRNIEAAMAEIGRMAPFARIELAGWLGYDGEPDPVIGAEIDVVAPPAGSAVGGALAPAELVIGLSAARAALDRDSYAILEDARIMAFVAHYLSGRISIDEILSIHEAYVSNDPQQNGQQIAGRPGGGVFDQRGAELGVVAHVGRLFAVWCADRRGPVGEAALAPGWTQGAALHRAPSGPLEKLFEQIASGEAAGRLDDPTLARARMRRAEIDVDRYSWSAGVVAKEKAPDAVHLPLHGLSADLGPGTSEPAKSAQPVARGAQVQPSPSKSPAHEKPVRAGPSSAADRQLDDLVAQIERARAWLPAPDGDSLVERIAGSVHLQIGNMGKLILSPGRPIPVRAIAAKQFDKSPSSQAQSRHSAPPRDAPGQMNLDAPRAWRRAIDRLVAGVSGLLSPADTAALVAACDKSGLLVRDPSRSVYGFKNKDGELRFTELGAVEIAKGTLPKTLEQLQHALQAAKAAGRAKLQARPSPSASPSASVSNGHGLAALVRQSMSEFRISDPKDMGLGLAQQDAFARACKAASPSDTLSAATARPAAGRSASAGSSPAIRAPLDTNVAAESKKPAAPQTRPAPNAPRQPGKVAEAQAAPLFSPNIVAPDPDSARSIADAQAKAAKMSPRDIFIAQEITEKVIETMRRANPRPETLRALRALEAGLSIINAEIETRMIPREMPAAAPKHVRQRER